MQTLKEESFGIVPVRQTDDIWQVFLIQQIGRRGDHFWAFPKGHAEPGEAALDTATRELHEETGLIPERIDEMCIFTEFYVFDDGTTETEKTVTYFLGFMDERKPVLQEAEIRAADWVSLSEARERLQHESKRTLIDELKNYLERSVTTF